MHINIQPSPPTTRTWQYNEKYTEADILQAWSNIMEAYSHKWNVFALDIKNEPNGIATWVRGFAYIHTHTPAVCLPERQTEPNRPID